METNPPGSQYHPDFPDCPSGADVVVTLVSRERTLFCVSANVLKAASRVFETILALPQPEESASSHPVIDNLDESASTIEGLLRMITAKELPPLDTIEDVEPLVLAAEKWEMPGPLSMLKMVLLGNSSFAEKHPIRLYWLGCRLKWVALQDLGAKFTCIDDIYHRKVLNSTLDAMDPGDLLRLVRFHRRRRDRMRDYLDGFALGRSICIYSLEYKLFRERFLEFMDNNPPGKVLTESALDNLLNESELEYVDKCKGHHCHFQHGSLSPEILSSLEPRLNQQWKLLPQDISKPDKYKYSMNV